MNNTFSNAGQPALQSDLAEAIERLEATHRNSAPSDDLPEALPFRSISAMPDVFYTRGKDWSERHVGLYCKTLQAGFDLEPLLVILVGAETVLVDGHHRLEAYGRVNGASLVPVRYFEGTPSKALLAAVEINARPSIQMDGSQRQNCAWRLVLTRLYSKQEICRASGVSPSQVANMRVAARVLGEEALDLPTWSEAFREWKKQSAEAMTDDEREDWVWEQGQRGADGLVKQFGMWLAKRPEIAACALALYFGRKLPEVYRELREHLSEEDCEEGVNDEQMDF